MTTLVATRRPLEPLSMSNQQDSSRSKRHAGRFQLTGSARSRFAEYGLTDAAAEASFERDDDFQFLRKSKKAKTGEPEAEPEPVRRSGRGRPPKTAASKEAQAGANAIETSSAGARGRPSRRKAGDDASQDEPELKVPKRTTRRSTRLSGENAVEETQANGAPRNQGRSRTKASRAPKWLEDSPPRAVPVASAKIALPMSDTPIINRNKEMRKKGNSNRRSSLGTRGRRASSLIESGQTAIPHREVDPAQFYKHIAADGLTEPRRMKQLLTWCGERSLAEKPPHGTPNSNAILGGMWDICGLGDADADIGAARAIQDQLLKDFASRSDFSDWFSRDDDPEKVPSLLQPNPKNIELDSKMANLEQKIKRCVARMVDFGFISNSARRLQEEKQAWLAMQKPAPEQPPLFSESEGPEIILPDFDLLDPDEGKIREFLSDEAESFSVIRSRTEARLRKLQSSLEFQVDQLADNVHKLEQRVLLGGKEADKILSLSAVRLQSREVRERTSAGTKDMPLMEVLRSLGKILPPDAG